VLLVLALSPLVGGLFSGDQRVDWNVYGVVAGLMAGTGLAASLIPAARAVRVDPVEALRRE
jgi:ABC-type lipoprotein release transport system permease subunit